MNSRSSPESKIVVALRAQMANMEKEIRELRSEKEKTAKTNQVSQFKLKSLEEDKLHISREEAQKSISQKVADILSRFEQNGNTNKEAIVTCRMEIFDACDRKKGTDRSLLCKGYCRYLPRNCGRTFPAEPDSRLCCVCAQQPTIGWGYTHSKNIDVAYYPSR